MEIQGKIVTLRPLSVNDAELSLRWRQGPRAKFLQRGAKTIEEQAQWILAHQKKDEFNYIIEYHSKPVGMIALLDINMLHKTAELGRLLIGEPELIKGVPVYFEAELLLCDYAYNEMGLHKIYGDVMEDNVDVIRMRKYLGYKVDGILREHYIFDGVYKDTVLVSLLENEYHNVCRPKLIQLINLLSVTSHSIE